MKRLWQAIVWSTIGSGIATIVWSFCTALVWPSLQGRGGAGRAIRELAFNFLGAAYWATYIAVLALPTYVVIFSVWLHVVGTRPQVESTRRRRVVNALLLALPPALAIGFSYGMPFLTPYSWRQAAVNFPIALVACWTGIWVARERTLRLTLRRTLAR